ncbi:MAG: glycosyltransferase family 87 protein [Litoreibacter sp.]|uniref:glycosyltransferase family 87 protein n=1 Tax=Litoreibacter sp. TaxID=1969459 RepID=UPI0032982BF0
MSSHFKPALLCLVFLAAMTLYFQGAANSDFLAVYLAGLSLANGMPDQVYPALIPVFDLSYPDSWRELATAKGVDETTMLYPFIYPPLWAVIASWVAPLISLSKVSIGLPVINSALLMGCSWLAWRITRSAVPLTLWLSVGFLTMATTTFGYVALAQGQPQILTTFLILLAIERSRADAPITAGGCLALAASIKVYPMLLVVIWLARKDWRSVASFIGFGVLAIIASVGLAGWPLHQTFLAQIGVISGSVLVTPLSYNFTALMTAFTQNVFAASDTFTSTTPSGLSLVNKIALILALLTAVVSAARASTDTLYACVWPLLLLAVSFFSPMSWSYHFLSTLAFAPLVFASDRVLPKMGLAYLVVASSIAVALVIGDEMPRPHMLFFAGLSSLVALAAAVLTARPKSGD